MAGDSEGAWPVGLDPEDDDSEVSSAERDGRPKRRFSLAPLGKSIASLASNVGESLARTAAAAGELLSDAELRSRSAALLTESAKKAGAGMAKGLQQGAGRIAAGPRTVQSVLQKLQHRIEEQRLQALLREQQDAPVDVQVAFQLYEDAPQELRSRLWMALLEHPELVSEYQTLAAELQQQRRQHATSSTSAHPAGKQGAAAAQEQQEQQQVGPAEVLEGAQLSGEEAEHSEMQGSKGQEQHQAGGDAEGSSTAGGEAPSGADPAHLSGSYSAAWAVHHLSASSASNGAAGSPQQVHGQPAARQPVAPAVAEEDGWQLVSDQAAARQLQGSPLLASAVGQPGYSRDREGFRNILMTAMMAIPWPLPSEYPPDCRYATLLQISLGQEEIDEVIQRDLHRTFPEHPLFAFEQGQQALFNVLKAYALHDMEASYCQGMAFVAGLLLFYVPEEPAFQLFCRLLSTSGPNLRRLYLPGLEGLKAELRKLEFLLDRYLPNLTAHLNAAGVVPVLYASQWLLTCYSCPFPVSFACRIVDVMLQENRDAILLKVAVAILAECEGDLLMQEGFEELLTHLKADVVTWSHARLRRVLTAALASPISQQDLADADAALEQGFTGSLSRGATFSGDAEREAAAAASSSGGEEAAGGGGGGGAAAAPPPGAAGQLQGGAAGAAGEDAVTADLAAAQQQIDDELMEMVMRLDLDFNLGGDGAQETYSDALHSALPGNTPQE